MNEFEHEEIVENYPEEAYRLLVAIYEHCISGGSFPQKEFAKEIGRYIEATEHESKDDECEDWVDSVPVDEIDLKEMYDGEKNCTDESEPVTMYETAESDIQFGPEEHSEPQPEDDIFSQLHDKLSKAEESYPEPNPNFRALISELGELAESLMDFEQYEDNTPEELMDVAVMALRVAKQKAKKVEQLESKLTNSGDEIEPPEYDEIDKP